MRIGFVGGLDRAEPRFQQLAATAGHEIMFHTGKVHGRGIQNLEQIAEHCEHVVIVTEENSHGAVQLTRKLLKMRGKEPILLRKCGVGRFASLLHQLTASPLAA